MPAPLPDTTLQRYLDALADSGVRSTAAKAVGLNPVTIYRRSQSDPEFAAVEAEAMELAADKLEEEARRRALEGVTNIKYTKDGESYEETRFSDTLMVFLLKGARPDKFADRQKSELSGPGGRAIDMTDTSMAARIASIIDAARQRKAQGDKIDVVLVDPFS